MPIAVELAGEQRRIDVLARGEVTQTERLAALERCIALLRARPACGVLFDGRAATTAPTTEETRAVTEAAIQAAPLFVGGIAFVVREGVQFGMGRMLQAFLSSYDIELEVFTNRSVAAAWLAGRPLPPKTA